MGMRLLPKNELDRAKAAEQQQTVEEGLKLARRIDNLRETAVSEEASLNEFRRKTVLEIHEQLEQENGKLIAVRTEVAELEGRRAKALEPLNKEREELDHRRATLEAQEKSLDEREITVSARETKAGSLERESLTLLGHVRADREHARTRLQEAARAHEAAEQTLADAQLTEKAVLRFKKETEAGLSHRETVVAGWERGVTIRESDLSAREKALADGWRLLHDRQAMLERTIKRKK